MPYNEKNQFRIAKTMRACQHIQSPFDTELLAKEMGEDLRLYHDQTNLYKFTMKMKDMKKEKIEAKVI